VRLSFPLDPLESNLLDTVDRGTKEIEILFCNARQEPHHHLMTDLPDLLHRNRAGLPENIGLHRPAHGGVMFGNHKEDLPVVREVVPGDDLCRPDPSGR